MPAFRPFLLLCAFALVPLTAAGQVSRPVRIVVPFPPGASPNDVTARILGPKLAEQTKQQVVVDNRPGAAGTIGTDIVAKSNPDGHTLLINSMTLTIVPNAYKHLPFDPYKDLAPIVMVAQAPQLVMVNATVPVTTLKELIAYVKQRPREFKFSSGGNGTVPHLAGELLNHMAGLQMSHIPYKGGAPAGAAMIAGEVQMYIDTATGSLGYIKAGKVKVLGVAAKQRTSLLPDVPTIEEAGLPGYEVVVWYGVFAPGKTPKATVQALNREFRTALAAPDVQSRFAALGTDVVGSTAEDFTKKFHADLKRWASFVKEAGLKLE
ncbi:MAG TPA: tripartite tricarboxylate transporter substrate binding protein [Burkholderiales bacterium]|nr:tripartite tricarboxylate transporter substrate binding protein [Burkholderiales bacterium]